MIYKINKKLKNKINKKLKNKKIRFVYYAIFGCSLLAIGFTSYYFYRVYKENIALKETMENIIKTHEQIESLSGDSSYTEYFTQDETVDSLSNGKIIISFPSN